MNLYKEIGGYFELYFKDSGEFFPDAIKLNCGRNCLKYIIKAFDIKEIHLPYYTCPVIWQSAKDCGCRINFYHINESFMPVKDFKKNDFILYTNYFGVCAKNVKELSEKYLNTIFDNAQAFYMQKYGIASFNSPRKFFGVSDGAYLYSDRLFKNDFEQDTSYQRFSHLLKRNDRNAEFGYNDFCTNDNVFKHEQILRMSNLTQKILSSIDYDEAKNKRLQNFHFLHSKLSKTNDLKINLIKEDVPMVYPYMTKNKELKKTLIKNKIYTATYWSNLSDTFYESNFQKYLIPLPIDQRYGVNEMKRIIKVIGE